jgi:DNA-directed RNA polymerase subunit M/transcription elongation factor TFIIS
MRFCDNCSNMLYIKISSDNSNKLIYYCRNCGNEDLMIDNLSISKINLTRSDQKFSHIINQYTKLDPTLPRVNKILCPNAECATNTEDVPREIIYIRFDDVNMKYVYLCSSCDQVWKLDENV